LATCSLDTDQSAPSRLSHIASKSYRRGRKTVSFPGFQFTMTFRPLTESHGAALLTWYREDSLARTSAPPEKVQASAESDPGCGNTWRGSLARYDRATSSWRTAQYSLHGDLELFSETWPRWGTMRSGECSERSMSEHLTDENASGFVGPNGEGLWPTATTHDHGTRYAQGGMPLGMAVRMWPTPQASDNRDRGNMSDPAIQRRLEIGKQVGLSMAVKDGPGGGSLNPTWVEWLMGWPVSWSSLTPLSHEHFNEWLARTKAGATRIQADILPRMRNQGQPAQTPQGPGQAEQHAGEHCDTVPSMPREGTREAGGLGKRQCSPSPLSDMRTGVPVEQNAEGQGVQQCLHGGNGQAFSGEAMGRSDQGEAMHELPKDLHIHAPASNDLQPVVREHSGPPEPWWSAEPVGVPRVATGIAKRADRLKAIGNGQVPQVAALAWNTLHERIQSRLNP